MSQTLFIATQLWCKLVEIGKKRTTAYYCGNAVASRQEVKFVFGINVFVESEDVQEVILRFFWKFCKARVFQRNR